MIDHATTFCTFVTHERRKYALVQSSLHVGLGPDIIVR